MAPPLVTRSSDSDADIHAALDEIRRSIGEIAATTAAIEAARSRTWLDGATWSQVGIVVAVVALAALALWLVAR
jgi:hypothetical protein